MANDPSIQSKLQALVDRFHLARDLKARIKLDIEFHRTLLESSGLEPLVAFGDLLHVFFQQFRESVKMAEWKFSIDSHQQIIDLLVSGDIATATMSLRHHIESHKERIR